MGSLVDPSYELVDPTPDVHALFCDFDRRFFDGRLAACEVKWSPRMTTCAGLCCYEVRSGLCTIKLSTPLLKLRPRSDLVETLLHEMIHAFLFVSVRDRDRDGHGPQFQWHMQRINKEAGTRITIYHSFHAEVAVYKQHHWRCSGPCRERRPFFGWVKRTTNRAPSKNDLWWADHERSCGGTYTKVAEPKEFTEKREKAERKKAEGGLAKRGGASAKGGGASAKGGGVKSPVTVDDPKRQPRIDAVFGGGGGGGGTRLGTAAVTVGAGVLVGGGGQMLGGVAGRSRLLDLMGGGGPGGKSSGTVAKENRSIAAASIDDDDDCVVIEPPPRRPILVMDRPRLRGGSQEDINLDESDNSRDGSDRAVRDDDEMHAELFYNDDEDDGCPPAVPNLGELEQMEKYMNGGGGGGYDDHNYGSMNSMPVLSPVHARHQSQYDAEIAQLERDIAAANVKLDDLMNDGGRDDEVMPQFTKIERMNKTLTELKGARDAEMAQRIHDEESANCEMTPDAILARQLQDEENAKQKKSQAIVDNIYARHSGERGQRARSEDRQATVAQRDTENAATIERRTRKCEEQVRRRKEETAEEEEERLRREQEEWEAEDRRRYPSRLNEPMLTTPEPRSDRLAEEEQGDDSDEVRRTRRRRAGRGRQRRETVDSDYWEATDDEQEEMLSREERQQMQQEEMVLEEVTVQRRHQQTYDMDIDEWMLLRSLPSAEEPPVYEDVGTLRMPARAHPAARGNQNTRQRGAARPARAAPAAATAAPSESVAAAASAAESAEDWQLPEAPAPRGRLQRMAQMFKRGGGTRGGKQPAEKRARGKKVQVDDDGDMVDVTTIEPTIGSAGGPPPDEMALSARAAAANRRQLDVDEAAGMEGVEQEREPSSGDQLRDHSDDDKQSTMNPKSRK